MQQHHNDGRERHIGGFADRDAEIGLRKRKKGRVDDAVTDHRHAAPGALQFSNGPPCRPGGRWRSHLATRSISLIRWAVGGRRPPAITTRCPSPGDRQRQRVPSVAVRAPSPRVRPPVRPSITTNSIRVDDQLDRCAHHAHRTPRAARAHRQPRRQANPSPADRMALGQTAHCQLINRGIVALTASRQRRSDWAVSIEHAPVDDRQGPSADREGSGLPTGHAGLPEQCRRGFEPPLTG